MSTNNPRPTTWQDLLAQLKDAQAALNGVEEANTSLQLSREELTRHVLQIERQLDVAGFDSLAQIESIPHADLAQLNTYVTQLKTSIAAGQTSGFNFSNIVQGILGTVKAVVLPGLGLGNLGSLI